MCSREPGLGAECTAQAFLRLRQLCKKLLSVQGNDPPNPATKTKLHDKLQRKSITTNDLSVTLSLRVAIKKGKRMTERPRPKYAMDTAFEVLSAHAVREVRNFQPRHICFVLAAFADRAHKSPGKTH